MPRTIGAYILAVIATAALATIVQTQFNLGFLLAMGVPVPFGVRLETTLFDLAGLGPTLAIVMAAALLIGFLVAAGIIRFLPRLRMLGYMLSGAVAMTAALLAMDMMFGFPPLAAARPLAGFLSLVATGAAGGLVFAILSGQQGESRS